jgi:hypothetical protein
MMREGRKKEQGRSKGKVMKPWRVVSEDSGQRTLIRSRGVKREHGGPAQPDLEGKPS